MRQNSAEGTLLNLIIKKYGGLTKFSKKFGVEYWQLSNWKLRGYVPFKRVGQIAGMLKVNPVVLNGRLISVQGVDTWKKEVSKLKLLTKEQIEHVLSLPFKFHK